MHAAIGEKADELPQVEVGPREAPRAVVAIVVARDVEAIPAAARAFSGSR